MMHGFNGFGHCVWPMGFTSYFGIWHYLILIGVGILFILAIGRIVKGNRKSEDAMNTLKQLYVSGHISDEEYLKRKSVIERK